MNEKVLVIGMDGATFDLLKPWMKEGKLLNIERLLKGGVHSTLESTIPENTPISWTSFITGKNPGKHGIFAFRMLQPGSYNLRYIMHSKDLKMKSKSLWSILSESGKNVGVINVPMTYPPEKVNGFMISGIPIPEERKDFTHPPDLIGELKEKIGDYRIQLKEKPILGNENAFLEDIEQIFRIRKKAILYFLKNYDWDFFMAVFYYTDTLQHWFWKYMDETHPMYDPEKAEKYGNCILEYYQKIDGLIGQILDMVNEKTTLIIMSDHGAGQLHKILHLNNWFMENGLLSLKKRSTLFNFSVNILKNSGIFEHLPSKLKCMIPEIYPSLSHVDWSKTKAWALMAGYIYLNVKGRQPQGIVEPGSEYEELRDYITQELYKIKDLDTGERVISRVLKNEECYWGEYASRGPDLKVLTKDGVYRTPIFFSDSIFSVPEWSGNHRGNGIIIMRGKNIRSGIEVKNSRIIDLAPTVLYIMGLPLPDDMDGKVLTEIFEQAFLSANPVRYQDVKTGEIYSESVFKKRKKQKERFLKDLSHS